MGVFSSIYQHEWHCIV